MKSNSSLVACASSLVLLLAGCGGGGEPASAPNMAPVANAGADQIANKRAIVRLSGTASADPDGDALAYRWTQTAGTPVSLGSSTAATPSFTAPMQTGELIFSLVVSDGKTNSVADTVHITVINRTPVANAGADTVSGMSAFHTLNGGASSDPDGDLLTHAWVQISGPAVVLTEVAPKLWRFTTPDTPATLEFALTVSDGESSSPPDTVLVIVQSGPANNAPVAMAAADSPAPRRSLVTLQGYGTDPEGSPLTYEWQQVSGPAVTLSSSTAQLARFTAPDFASVLEFDLRVSDGQLTSQPARLVVTVQNFPPNIAPTEISPVDAYTVDTLTILPLATDPDRDSLAYSYAWSRNGSVVATQTGGFFPSSLTTRGDVISVTVTVSDGLVTTTQSYSRTILDSPPVLTAVANQSADHGDTVSFPVTVTDADGDPAGAFEIRHGPAGMTVDGTGTVTWQAGGPMFGTEQDFHWGIGLVNYPGLQAEGTIHVTDAARQSPLVRSGIVVPQLREELVVTDLQGDGTSEIIVANRRLLAVMSRSASGWAQTWVSQFQLTRAAFDSIEALAVAEVTGDSHQEIFVASPGRIVQLTGADHVVRKQYDWQNAQSQCGAMRVADLDGNGRLELVCLRTNSVYGSGETMLAVFDATDLTLNWTLPVAVSAPSLAVGNVDNDAALEIVLAQGLVYDGASRANEWLYGPGFGSAVDVGDLDGDGVAEVVGMQAWGNIRAFSAVSRTPLAELTGYGGGTAVIRLADLDGDNHAELLVGDAQWGNVHIHGFNSTTLQWHDIATMNSQDHGVSALAVGNVDADPSPEVIWGTGVSSSGQDILVVSQFQSGSLSLEWSSESSGQLDGPFLGGMLAQVAPGSRRLMYLTPRTLSGYGGSRLLTMNPSNGDIAVSGELGSNWANLGALDVADYDQDGVQEAFIASATLYAGFLATYDFAAAAVHWQTPNGFAEGVAVAHGDANGDGAADFAVLGTSGKITVVDPLHSAVIWQSTTLDNSGGRDIAMTDLDQDGRPEIIALTASYLYVYGSANAGGPYLELGNISQSGAIDLLVADVAGDSKPEILVMSADGTGNSRVIRIYDAARQFVRAIYPPEFAVSMVVEPGSSMHRNLLVGTVSNSYYSSTPPPDPRLLAIDARSGGIVWESPAIAGQLNRNSLHAIDVNDDGQYEVSWANDVSFGITR